MSDTAPPIEFGQDGLIPVVIVDAVSGDVLMVGFQNREAFDRTRETGQVHFWSRSRSKLWRKGETSGHTQTVREIRVNCENNSLLIEVEQRGAVCHEGYATCYYRRLEPDNSLTIIRDRVFDPADVYQPNGAGTGLADLTQTQLAAYQFLAEQPLISESRTSRLLHGDEDSVTPRIADELNELAGVLDGTHVHSEPASDASLEAGQVIYWLLLRAVRDGIGWNAIRADRAFDMPTGDSLAPMTLARLLRRDAAGWKNALGSAPTSEREEQTAARMHATLALVGQALAPFGVNPKEVIARDLAELRTKPYLAPFFAAGVAPQRP